jgi:hypothetical protein
MHRKTVNKMRSHRHEFDFDQMRVTCRGLGMTRRQQVSAKNGIML